MHSLYLRHMTTVVCALLQNQTGHYLLVQRSNTMPHPGAWEFPGGKVEQGESYAEALTREVREELHLDIQVSRKGKAVAHRYREKYIKLVPLFCRLYKGLPKLSEHVNFRWVEASELIRFPGLLEADVRLLRQNGF